MLIAVCRWEMAGKKDAQTARLLRPLLVIRSEVQQQVHSVSRQGSWISCPRLLRHERWRRMAGRMIYLLTYLLTYFLSFFLSYLPTYLSVCSFICLLVYLFNYLFSYLCMYICMYVCMHVRMFVVPLWITALEWLDVFIWKGSKTRRNVVQTKNTLSEQNLCQGSWFH